MSSSKLEQLKKMTVVVADTGDVDAIEKYQPEDATTNPSLLLKAAALPRYQSQLKDAVIRATKSNGSNEEQAIEAAAHLAVAIGKEILQIIPGRVSTEVDARYSHDTQKTVELAHKLVSLYEAEGISTDRLLIKIASTWEGLQAAKQLQKENIDCNLTLLFCFEQAAIAADVGATLISPFVGRILDWHKKQRGVDHIAPEQDPGVESVSTIYNYYKQHSYNTIVMGASFRNTGEIEQLAGCDRLTISPTLLQELSADNGELERKLSPDNLVATINKPELTENYFTAQLKNNPMASEKLDEGIKGFIADQIKLEELLLSVR